MNNGRALAVALLVITFTIGVPAQLGSDINKGSWAGSDTLVPQYQIVDLGLVQSGDSAAQGFRVSEGGVAVGRSIRTGGAQAFSWTQASGIVGLTNLAGRAYCVANSATDNGSVVGTCASSLTGTGRLPVMWQNGTPTQLALPSGQTIADANDVNTLGIAVGSTNSGSAQRGVIYTNGTGAIITQTTAGGSFFVTAFSINDNGTVVGQGIDPVNAARNVGLVYDIGAGTVTEVGALSGRNGALAFGISNAGHVVGSSMQNQGSGLPFIWTQAGGMVEIPLPTGTTQGSARAVNSNGWAVGTASSNFAIPFLYDGTSTHRLADLLPAGSGWDLSTNTSSSALGISESGVIVGTGMTGGQIHAYAMVPVVTNVSVGGRILTASGTGIGRAYVTISGGNLPAPVAAYTSSFGYYTFEGLQSGMTYTVTVYPTKRYQFASPTQTVTPQGNIGNLDFIADPE